MEFQQRVHDLPRHGLSEVGVAKVDAFLAAADSRSAVAVLLSAGDPVRWPEAIDVAIVLAELIDAFQGHLSGAVIGGVPRVALAADENFEDSAERQGAVLAGSRRGRDALRALAGSFDPCVSFSLNFREAADA